jgi:hypothetical protein
MQIRWRKNPKTEDGWFKWTAISLLAGLGVFTLTLPVAFLLFLNHLQHAYPNDTQNFLGAITAAVVSGLALGGLCFAASMAVFFLLSFRGNSIQT